MLRACPIDSKEACREILVAQRHASTFLSRSYVVGKSGLGQIGNGKSSGRLESDCTPHLANFTLPANALSLKWNPKEREVLGQYQERFGTIHPRQVA
jgi:hypothetical protein